MSKMKQSLHLLMLETVLHSKNPELSEHLKKEATYKSVSVKPRRIPKGSKVYSFDKEGFEVENQDLNECVFSCVAINLKNAKRKFVRWNKNKSQT